MSADVEPPRGMDLRLRGDVELLRVGPDDVVVITAAMPLTTDECDALKTAWARQTGLANRTVVLAEGLGVKTVRAEPA